MMYHLYRTQLQSTEALSLFYEWEEDAKKAIPIILYTDLLELKKEISHPNFVYLLSVLYKATALTPYREVKEKLAEVGLRPLHQRWFVPHQFIVTELYHIVSDGKVTLRLRDCLQAIKDHLDIKINTDLLLWGGFTAPVNGKHYATKLKADFNNILRRRRYIGGGQPLKDLGTYDQELNALLDLIIQHSGDASKAGRLVMQLSDGITKKTFLRRIVESADTTLKKDAFYRRFFPLFRLICSDEHLMSYEDFVKVSTAKGEHSQYMETSYKSYQSQRVKQLIS
ncbi:MAG: hypothetical protein EOO06_13050 [Chitinophagaceae bacterium]|nr:MAG: hypothetical protein EOO06_13050 [Chitinophagaceae bacterium]